MKQKIQTSVNNYGARKETKGVNAGMNAKLLNDWLCNM